MTDWNLIVQGNISLIWLYKCMEPENANKSVGELLFKFKKENENISLINPGVLMMAAYLFFVYPKESGIIKYDLSSINIDSFKILVNGQMHNDETEKQYLLRRLRNSIAHGNWNINDDLIEFCDNNPPALNNPFKVDISLTDFGSFINEFMFYFKDQYFQKQKY